MANKWALLHNLTIKYRQGITHTCTHTKVYICTLARTHHSYKNSNLVHELSCSYSLTLSLNNFNCNNINWSSSICTNRDFSCEIRHANILFDSSGSSAAEVYEKSHWNSDIIYKEFVNKLCLATHFIITYCCSSCKEWIENRPYMYIYKHFEWSEDYKSAI